ncbi:hypothetical protein [Actinoplanes subtropicus]|uniref:hypothetical protein n=1 Tax=Actinoplanes subtropicus TaxID=543632 RepID=UPI0004C3A019|nr:hypothetical protein [Actinoplanes subtropicus]
MDDLLLPINARVEVTVAVEVRIPAQFVATGWGTPTVCARHGEPAVEQKRVTFISRNPGWSYLLLLAALLVFVIVTAAIRKSVVAPAWPFCARCKQERKQGVIMGLGILAAGVVAFALTGVLPDSSGGLAAFIGFLLLLTGLIVALRGGSWVMRANGHVIDGGQAVQFDKAHESFAAQAFAAQQAASQYAAPTQPPFA